jgi:hypothetical protein
MKSKMQPLIDFAGLTAHNERPDSQLVYTPIEGGGHEVQGGTVAEIVEALWACSTVHFAHKRAWSVHELLMALLEQTGQADVTISTYAISEQAARQLALRKDDGGIRNLAVLLDQRVDVRTAGSLQLVRNISDRLGMTECHAKVTLIEGAERQFAVIGSANYSENKRWECGLVTSNAAVIAMHKHWINGIIDAPAD